MTHRYNTSHRQAHSVFDLAHTKTIIFAVALIGALFYIAPVSAQTCGTIEDPISRESVVIADCENPFAVTRNTLPSDFPLVIAGTAVTDSAVTVSTTGPFFTDIVYTPELVGGVSNEFVAYQEVNGNYEIVTVRAPNLSRNDPPVVAAFADYFADNPDIAAYQRAFQTDGTDHLTDAQKEVYFDFEDEVLTPLLYPTTPRYAFQPGTYTLLFYEQEICLVQSKPTPPHWWQTVKAWLLPTAHAYCHSDPTELDRFTVTLTVEQAPTDPTGASSVLFLPGIQASRLYREGHIGIEKLWEPNFLFEDSDVRKLALDENGVSVNDIFTKDIIDAAGSLSIYQSFINFLEAAKAESLITDFAAYAYDWRYDVYDIVSSGTQYENEVVHALDIFDELAAESDSGRVTIIGHSNGGLLGKALIDELVRLGKTDQIEQLIMVGTPQLGTPKAIASLLHGIGQGIDVLNGNVPVLKAVTAREIGQNMPGAYGLLPGAKYFTVSDDPIVTFMSGEATNHFIDLFGNSITNVIELDRFLTNDENGRTTIENLDEAIVANKTLLSSARHTRAALDHWEPPAGISVHTIVGVGRNTIRGLEYRTFTERVCTVLVFCGDEILYKPIPQVTTAGDGTVVVESAAWQPNAETQRWYVDLNLFEAETSEAFHHANLTEAPPVQALLRALLMNATATVPFISTSYDPSSTAQVLLGAHSPVYLYIQDAQGRQTGQLDADTVVVDIPNTEFFTLGDSSYIITPQDLQYTVYTVAYAAGGMTLTMHSVTNEQQLTTSIPVPELSSTTVVSTVYNGESLSVLNVDFENDGVTDAIISADGTIESLISEVVTAEPEIAGETFKNNTGSRLPRVGTPQVAGIATSTLVTSDMADTDVRHLLLKIIARLLLLQSYGQR